MNLGNRSPRWIRRTLQAGLVSTLALAGLVTFSTVAGANAANPNDTTTATAVENGDGTVSVNIGGTWSWPGQDCAGRFGTGWSVDWWGISSSSTPSPSFNLSDASLVSPPGTTTTGTMMPDGSVPIPGGTFFHVGQVYSGETVNSALTCTDTGSGKTAASNGSWTASATYPSVADVPPSLCVNMYDLHGMEGTISKNAMDFSPSGNNDNSIQTNNFNPTADPGYCAVITFETPNVAVVKTGPATGTAGGDGTYTMTATNSGTAPAPGVVITDTLPVNEAEVSSTDTFGTCTVVGPVVSCPVGSLAANGGTASITVTVSYPPASAGSTLTDCATVANQETPSCVNTTIPENPAITLVKSANVSLFSANGTSITYSYLVTNTGGVTLNPVTVTDPMTGLSAIHCPDTSLAPTGTETCHATYTTVQADLDRGHIDNTGTATGTPPTGPDVTATSSVTIPAAEITLVKSASVTSYSASGSVITYSYLVTNTGEVRLNPVTVSDPMTGLSAINCPHTSLAAAASETCHATYTTTQADVDAGSLSNTGTAHGTPPTGPNVTATSTVTIAATQSPAITLLKSANVSLFSANGTPIIYSYLVTNTGNVTLNPVVVSDPMTGLSAINCPHTSLAPTGSETCTATYTTIQADLDRGHIDNTGTATGTPPSGPTVHATSSVSIPAAKITLVKSASVSSYSTPGILVTYSYLVTNTGEVTLNPVTMSDPMVGLSAISCPDTTLAPAASETCHATYTTTQADVDAGSISNTGTATGTPPSGPNVTATSTVTITGTQSPAITLLKSANVAQYTASGQAVIYSYLVTNTGNVTLNPVVVTDPMVGLSAISCPDASLAPAATETCTATYTTTAADVTAGHINNTGTATGTPPSGPNVMATSSVSIPAHSGGPGGGGVDPLTILKQVCGSTVASDCGSGGAGPWVSSTTIPSGSTAYWKITVTNTGSASLGGIVISDPLAASCVGAAGTTTLAAGASESFYCSSANVVTSFTNVATVTYTGQPGTPPSSSASVTVAVATVAAQPAALAFTGLGALGLKVFGGFAMVLLGLGLVLAGRRRGAHAAR